MTIPLCWIQMHLDAVLLYRGAGGVGGFEKCCCVEKCFEWRNLRFVPW